MTGKDTVELPLLRTASFKGYQSVVVDDIHEENWESIKSEKTPSYSTASSASAWILLTLSSALLMTVLVYSAIPSKNTSHTQHFEATVSLLESRFDNWEDWKHQFHASRGHVTDWFLNETTWIKNKTQNWIDHHPEHNEVAGKNEVLYFNDSLAYEMLRNGKESINTDYFRVSSLGWDAQVNQAYCAVATSTAILNSFRGTARLPVDSAYDPYHYATQHDIWNTCTEKHVIHHSDQADGVLEAPGGLGMAQTKALLECNLPRDWSVEAHYVDPSRVSQEKMKRDIQRALSSPEARVQINYHRARVHQVGGGHWSPVVGYSYERDAFLILDVAKYKYPPAWVPSKLLYESLASMDPCGVWDFPIANKDLQQDPATQEEFAAIMKQLNCQSAYRGYIIVKKPKLSTDKQIAE